MNDSKTVKGFAQHRVDIWLPAAIGVFGLLLLVVLADKTPEPSPFQAKVYGTILALSASAFAALIPGLIHVDVSLPGLVVRAAGAIAVFSLVFFNEPAQQHLASALGLPESPRPIDGPAPGPKPAPQPPSPTAKVEPAPAIDRPEPKPPAPHVETPGIPQANKVAPPSSGTNAAVRGGTQRLSGEDPVFPREAIRDGVAKGRVRARLRITPQGNVSEVIIMESEPPGVFDAATRSALSTWKFKAEGEAYQAETEVNFALKD